MFSKSHLNLMKVIYISKNHILQKTNLHSITISQNENRIKNKLNQYQHLPTQTHRKMWGKALSTNV